jgi:ABC-type nitrate/sulfonate/bicarbonate transport system substrate-binding protein
VADFADVPRLVAERELASDGSPATVTEFARPELAIEALARAEADIAIGSIALAWAAAGRGAPIVTVMEVARSRHVVAAVGSIESCGDLNGRRVAVNSLGATGGELFSAFRREACPEAKPNVIVVQGNQNRAAALLTGTIDAAVILRDDAIDLEQRAPGRVKVLEDFGVRWPRVMSIGVFVERGFATKNRRAVQDYLRACLVAQRTIATDASRLEAAARETLGGDRAYHAVAAAYIEARAWDPNGGLMAESVNEAMRFLVRGKTLPENVAASSLVDRSVLDSVLDEIGRVE